VLVGLGHHQITAGFQVLDNSFSGLVAIHAAVDRDIGRDMGVFRQHIDDRQIVSQPHLEVIRIVGGCDFHDPGAEITFDIVSAMIGISLLTIGRITDLPIRCC
jgi:hypothetical protein